ncbi:MAG: hypothetical protein OES15_01105 [Nitrosopumilus sp.]|nr:hypothetical protein [Nitrosopumilus sp.]MDH3852867.1 hypothetical protein [Nitrosopumilus sp.]
MSQTISLDIGTGFVKACSVQKKVRFPSLYAYRDADPWENNKKGTTIVEGAGYDAVEIARHPSAVLLQPVREGTPSNKTAFVAVVNQAIKRLEISDDSIPKTSIIIGLPYHAAKDAIKFPSFVKKITNCKDVMVVPQTIGTLMSSRKKDGIVLAIGQGTTELVAFDNLKPILGRSIPQACDYIHLGSDELQYLNNSNKPNPKRIEMLADIISENLASFKTNLAANNSYDIILSGGGILVPGLYNHLKRKIADSLCAVGDPVFSNATGMLEYAKSAMN